MRFRAPLQRQTFRQTTVFINLAVTPRAKSTIHLKKPTNIEFTANRAYDLSFKL
jgi:hypothetical protein